VTARLATHPDVAARTADVLERLLAAGVDVEFAGAGVEGEAPLAALRAGSIDLALVGIQALRGSAADDVTTVAVLPREEVRDVLVTLSDRRAPLHDLPAGARVGVAGARRSAFLRAHRPDIEVVPLTVAPDAIAQQGGVLDAVIISALDARRGGLVAATVEVLDGRAWLPEPGQGAVALVARHPIAEATALDHLPTRTALRAELALLDALDADADAPLGCVAQPSGRWIRLWAGAASADGTRLVRSDRTGPLDEPEALGASVAQEMRARGYGLVESVAG
jgi:hydroxymethylbilane synthase